VQDFFQPGCISCHPANSIKTPNSNKQSRCTKKHITPANHQAPQFVVPELILDAYRHNEEENAEAYKAQQVFPHQVPTERVDKEVFACNHNACHN